MLEQKLYDYAKSDYYPFHMPGHKRQLDCRWNPYELDITEIDGFDNLHHAQEILKESQERAAKLYGAGKSYYLVNGSTCGLLATICAATGKGDRILVARNCHKAVYHALFLNELSPIYLYPTITGQGIQGQISTEQIQQALEKNPDIRAVIITSPTYDGVVSDVKSIAEVVHRYDIPLIVDEAHGAHFGFTEGLPENAVQLGADAVIVSVHKTLPAFTQTALLHLCENRISQQKIEKYLGIFETSSPSYILMAGIDRCVRMMMEQKEGLFPIYIERLRLFYEKLRGLKHLRVVRKKDFSPEEAYDFDETKILIFTDAASMTGMDLYETLLHKYKIQLEMVAGNYVLALSSVMDTQEGFDRLAKALLEIDDYVDLHMDSNGTALMDLYGASEETICLDSSVYQEQEKILEISEAENLEHQAVELEAAIDKVSANFIYLYPPGIPIVVPGERITEKFVEDIRKAQKMNLDLEGLVDDRLINIVIF